MPDKKEDKLDKFEDKYEEKLDKLDNRHEEKEEKQSHKKAAERAVGKLGLLPFVHNNQTLGLISVSNQVLTDLGTAPGESFAWHNEVSDAIGNYWGMAGTDRFPCSAQADNAYQLMVWSANTGDIILPSDDEVINLWRNQTGSVPEDESKHNGTNPAGNANWLMKDGFLGHKIDAWVPVSTNHPDKRKWGIHLFGGAKFCLNLPKSAQEQFFQGKPWDIVPDDKGKWGDLDVYAVQYFNDSGIVKYLGVAWGQLQVMTEAFLEKYLTMTIICLSKEWLKQELLDEAKLDYQDLVYRLKSLG